MSGKRGDTVKIEVALIDKFGNGIFKEVLDFDDMESVKESIESINVVKEEFPQYEEWVRVI